MSFNRERLSPEVGADPSAMSGLAESCSRSGRQTSISRRGSSRCADLTIATRPRTGADAVPINSELLAHHLEQAIPTSPSFPPLPFCPPRPACRRPAVSIGLETQTAGLNPHTPQLQLVRERAGRADAERRLTDVELVHAS